MATQNTQSKPLTFGELKAGQKFISFPTDGDDSGHGGFRKGAYLFTKLRAVTNPKADNAYNHYCCATQRWEDHYEVYLVLCDDNCVRIRHGPFIGPCRFIFLRLFQAFGCLKERKRCI